MKSYILAAFMAVIGSAAAACPDYTLWGEQYEVSAKELYAPKEVSVVAGGNFNLQKCGIRARNWTGAMPGFVIDKPDFSISVKGLSGFQLEFRVVSECDSTLLINTAGANWYFDDDDNEESPGDPKIRLTRPSGDGVYDIWIGTYDGQQCNARLVLESF